MGAGESAARPCHSGAISGLCADASPFRTLFLLLAHPPRRRAERFRRSPHLEITAFAGKLVDVVWKRRGTQSLKGLRFDLDLAIQRLGRDLADNPVAQQTSVQLTGVYHNLLRQWAEV